MKTIRRLLEPGLGTASHRGHRHSGRHSLKPSPRAPAPARRWGVGAGPYRAPRTKGSKGAGRAGFVQLLCFLKQPRHPLNARPKHKLIFKQWAEQASTRTHSLANI